MRALFCVVLAVSAGCAGRPQPPSFTSTTMPNPDGCFIRVWDAPQLAGMTDFINGPRDYPTLRDLPGGRLWNNRIESAATGPAARVTLWTDENFQGMNLTLTPDTEYRRLPDSVTGQVESMNIACQAVSTE